MIPNLPKPNVEFAIENKIYVKSDFLSSDICNDIIKFGEENVNPGVSKYPTAFSVKFHSCLLPLNHYIHDMLQPIWEDISNFFNFDISMVEPYELKRYERTDFFGKHVDNYYGLTSNLDRKITISIQLSKKDEYQGGKLTLPFNKSMDIDKGTIVAFPSFFPHQVSIVTSGVRWSLITWAWGPYWR